MYRQEFNPKIPRRFNFKTMCLDSRMIADTFYIFMVKLRFLIDIIVDVVVCYG